MTPDDVTNCMRCNSDLERGYSSRWEAPKGGEAVCKEVICFKCDKKESLENHMKSNVITTNFMMDCLMEIYDLMSEHTEKFGGSRDTRNEEKLTQLLSLDLSVEQLAKVSVQIWTTRIQNKIKEFDSKVWFKGLQDHILNTTSRGVSAKLGKKHKNFCVLTWTCAGRTMITIEDDDAMVTAVADETSKESRTGLHGINATGEQAVALVEKAIALYEDGTLKFKDDDKVSMFGVG